MMLVVSMGLGLCLLIGLLAFVVYKDYQRRAPERVAVVANVSLETLERREIVSARAAGAALIFVGGLKAVVTVAVVATAGIADFASSPLVVKSSPALDWIVLVYTLAVSAALVVGGVLVFRRRLWTYWFAVAVSTGNLLGRSSVPIPTFAEPRVRGGLFLLLLAMLLPGLAFIGSVLVLQARAAVSAKRNTAPAG